jgi:hypothetical protein
MDPASAIGIASAVITFIGFSREFISTAYSIYNSSAQKTLADQTLEEVTLQLQRLSRGFLSLKPTMDQSETEIAMSSLAARCSILSAKILALLKKTQATGAGKGKPLLKSLKIASKSIWTEKEILQLRDNLDQCMTLLLQHWTILQRYTLASFLRL